MSTDISTSVHMCWIPGHIESPTPSEQTRALEMRLHEKKNGGWRNNKLRSIKKATINLCPSETQNWNHLVTLKIGAYTPHTRHFIVHTHPTHGHLMEHTQPTHGHLMKFRPSDYTFGPIYHGTYLDWMPRMIQVRFFTSPQHSLRNTLG